MTRDMKKETARFFMRQQRLFHTFRFIGGWLRLLLAFLFLVPAAGAAGKITGMQTYDIPPWFKESFLDIEEDAIEAGEAGRHLLVFFHLKDCPYCSKMLADSFAPGTANESFIREYFDSVEINIRGAREVSYRGDALSEKTFSQAVAVQYTPTLLFFDSSGAAVLTLSGYRSPPALARALNYIREEAYQHTSLTDYSNREDTAQEVYTLRAHPDFHALSDLSAVEGPLMLILEDDSCDECPWVHDNILRRADVRKQLQQLTAVRLDAKSDALITAPNGERLSLKDFARRLRLPYRPGIVFYEDGQEIFRVTGLLGHYHFREAVRYVAIGHRKAYPTFNTYLRVRRQELLAAGHNIDYSL